MTGLVTIYGGSGFLGRYITRRLAQQGWRVRVACRRPEEALFVRTYGVVGQVEPVFCNIRDDDSVRAAMTGTQAVVNCVGVLAEKGRNTFGAVQEQGPERIARLAAELGVTRMVHVSAIGADENSPSEYARSKAAGEQAVLRHMPQAVILRPSILFGAEDEFFNRFASMAQISPVIPVVGANTKFQPVHVDDVAHAASLAIEGRAAPGIYELGGPDVHSFRELIAQMLQMIRRRRMVLSLPFGIGRIMAGAGGLVQTLSLGLVRAPITADQVANLRRDNVVSPGAKTFTDLGLSPIAMEAVLPDYLWRFRPSGQYLAIKESARNLRNH